MVREMPMLIEKEIVELTEGPESKKDKKNEKKNFLFFGDIESIYVELSSSHDLDIYNYSILEGIYPDILTPPPELNLS
jgi:hypothetical protein